MFYFISIYGDAFIQGVLTRINLILFLFLVVHVSSNVATDLGVMGSQSETINQAHVVNVSEFNESLVVGALRKGSPIILLGEQSSSYMDLLNTSLHLRGESDHSTKTVTIGVLLEKNLGRSVEHSLRVKDYSYHEDLDDVYLSWLNDSLHYPQPPFSYSAVRTEVEYQQPYGVLETRTEIVEMNDTSNKYDWYDVTVSQTLTPGSNTSESTWRWKALTYSMNGSMGVSNVVLTDYDEPPTGEAPSGFFTFLWRVLRFDLRDLFPWLYPKPIQIESFDYSDYGDELFFVKYQAPEGYLGSSEPLSVRHHYVLRVMEDMRPQFWQQTQVKYEHGDVIAAPFYVSPLLHEGYMEFQ